MRGRTPVGPELADQLDGSTLARKRMRVILETIAGTCRVQEACDRLGICEQRFEALRAEAIAAGIDALELKPAGRPPRSAPQDPDEIDRLRRRVEELEAELTATRVRVELAAVLPRLQTQPRKKLPPRSTRIKPTKAPRPRPGTSSQSP